MRTGWRLEAVREVRLVAFGLASALLLIGLIGLAEKGPVVPEVPMGPSPLSPLSYGTLSFYEIARSAHRATIVFTPEDIDEVSSGRCLYVVVSPMVPMDRGRAATLVESLRKNCGSVSVLVADEEDTSNGLLEALNSTIRVVGNRVVIPIGGSSYHPKAYLSVGGRIFTITLDLASEVVGGRTSGYTVGAVVGPSGVGPESDLTTPAVRTIPVASEEVVEGVHVYVLGDGSVLLNQVLNSGDNAYREFAKGLLDYLCAYDRECTVVFDAGHYASANPFALIGGGTESSEVIVSLMDTLYVAAAAAMAMAHPAVWFPSLLESADRFLRAAVFSPLAYAIIPLAAFYFSRFFYYREVLTRDRPLPEQMERDVYIAADLRRSVLRGTVKIEARDFVNLYSMVNATMAALVGVRLSDDSFPSVLGRYVGSERALKYWRGMNKLYKRATRESLWPPVVLWKRAVLRYLDESESVLNSLGESLVKTAELELLIASGGALGGSRQQNP